MRFATLIGPLFYVTALMMIATTVLQLVSVSGFDLTSLLPSSFQLSDTTDPEVYFIMPILALCAPLVLVLWLGGRLKKDSALAHTERGAKNLLSLSFAYSVLNMGYALIRLHGGNLGILDGRHVLHTGDSDRFLSSAEYHRDGALLMAYLMSGAMTVVLLLALLYRDWLREVGETTSRTSDNLS